MNRGILFLFKQFTPHVISSACMQLGIDVAAEDIEPLTDVLFSLISSKSSTKVQSKKKLKEENETKDLKK